MVLNGQQLSDFVVKRSCLLTAVLEVCEGSESNITMPFLLKDLSHRAGFSSSTYMGPDDACKVLR